MRYLIVLLALVSAKATAAPYQVEEKTIATLQADMVAGRISSAELVRAYLARIESLDRKGPRLHAVIAVNPKAIAESAARCMAFRSWSRTMSRRPIPCPPPPDRWHWPAMSPIAMRRWWRD